MEIGIKLKKTRVKSGFTQEQVAEELMNIATVKSNRKMIIVGWVTIILALVLSITDIVITQSVIDFITSAVPWILLGVGVAIICAYMNNRKENK